ncbi:MAG: VC0807 family protein [Verrucomicrobiota bacterium]
MSDSPDSTAPSASSSSSQPKEENALLSLILNIILPVVVLTKLSGQEHLGPVLALVIATALPLAYGIYDYVRRREINLFSSLGIVSVILTGSLGLLKVDAIVIAIKEGLIPLVLGAAFVASAKTKKPLLGKLVLTPQIMDIKAIEHLVEKNQRENDFQSLLWRSSLLMGLSMLVASVLSFLVAVYTLKSEPGSVEFDKELGHLIYRSLIVAGIPMLLVGAFAFWYLVRGLREITGLENDDIFNPR